LPLFDCRQRAGHVKLKETKEDFKKDSLGFRFMGDFGQSALHHRSQQHLFSDRAEAGKHLASKLQRYANKADVLVLALPRGGVPVAFEVSRELKAPLDVFVVRKLGVPGQEELAMGAIATGGVRVLNREVIKVLGISDRLIEEVASREAEELLRRERLYRGDRPAPQIAGRIVILIDDGLATGSTMRAAIAAVRQQGPARVVVGVPVAAASTCDEFRPEVDEIVCAVTPEPFYAVGEWYENFSQTTDQETHELLRRAACEHTSNRPA
jgi:putative phosphoribosyl transferase